MPIILAYLDYAVKPCEATKMKPKHGSALLREWQEKNNYTGKQAAKVLECTHQQLSHWETMRHIPDADRRFDIERRTDGYVPANRWSNPA